MCPVYISESRHVFTGVGHLCRGPLTNNLHPAERGSERKRRSGVWYVSSTCATRWEPGMVGPQMNWQSVCPAEDSRLKPVKYTTLAKQKPGCGKFGTSFPVCFRVSPSNPLPSDCCQTAIPYAFPQKASHNGTPNLFLRNPIPTLSFCQKELSEGSELLEDTHCLGQKAMQQGGRRERSLEPGRAGPNPALLPTRLAVCPQ